MPIKFSHAIQNWLLAALPRKELNHLRPKLQLVDLRGEQVLAEAGSPLRHVYFPETALISLVRPMLDGAMVDIAMVGREGFVGMGVVLGSDVATLGKTVQSAGSALRIPAATLRKELDSCPVLKRRLMRFVQAVLSQIVQSSACNARHDVQQRLACWLLTARYRIDGEVLAPSHEFLAMMLGVRRSGVTGMLEKFKRAGLLHYSDGKITLLDRAGLEAAACECYGVVRDKYERLLSLPVRTVSRGSPRTPVGRHVEAH